MNYKTLFASLVLILASLLSTQTFATQLNFVGAGSYIISGSTVTVKFDRLENYDPNTTSGTITLKLMAMTSDSPTGTGYLLGSKNLSTVPGGGNGTLSPGQYFYNINFGTSYTGPPAGTYYVYLIAVEYPNLNTVLASVSATGNPAVFGGGGTGGGGSGSGSGSSGGSSSDINLVCSPCGYNISTASDTVNLTATRVVNNRTGGFSGTLKLALWATDTPYSGGTISGYIVGEYRFSSVLSGGSYFYDIDRTVDYSAPPSGSYYLTMTLSEFDSGTFYIKDWITYEGTETFGSTGGSGDSGGGSSSGGGSGDSGGDSSSGGCSVVSQGSAVFDPTLPFFVILGTLYLFSSRVFKGKQLDK